MKIKGNQSKQKAGSKVLKTSIKKKPAGAGKIKRPSSKNTAKPKKRVRDNIDAWDTGAGERKQYELEKKSSSSKTPKRMRFQPAPASFSLPSRTEVLAKKMGEFAGPLLGSLWEAEDEKTDQVRFDVVPESLHAKKEERKRKNPFSALASSDEDDSVREKKSSLSVTKKINFMPPILSTTSAVSSSSSSFKPQSTTKSLFKPAIFDAEEVKKSKPTNTKPTPITFTLKPPTFVAPALADLDSQLGGSHQQRKREDDDDDDDL